jgi:hypothetical protein
MGKIKYQAEQIARGDVLYPLSPVSLHSGALPIVFESNECGPCQLNNAPSKERRVNNLAIEKNKTAHAPRLANFHATFHATFDATFHATLNRLARCSFFVLEQMSESPLNWVIFSNFTVI